MSEDRELTFADVLNSSIQRWYESDSDFARQASVSSSAVSRYAAGLQIPKPDTIEKMAPWIKDDRGRPYAATKLLGLAYPGIGFHAGVKPDAVATMHPLALDVARLLSADSALPAETREVVMTLLEHLLAPYRKYLRKRKAA